MANLSPACYTFFTEIGLVTGEREGFESCRCAITPLIIRLLLPFTSIALLMIDYRRISYHQTGCYLLIIPAEPAIFVANILQLNWEIILLLNYGSIRNFVFLWTEINEKFVLFSNYHNDYDTFICFTYFYDVHSMLPCIFLYIY